MTDGTVWEIVIELPSDDAVAGFEAAIAGLVTGLSSFEVEGTPRWRITGYADTEPDRAPITANVAVAAAAAGISAPDILIQPVADRDWVAESERTLTPIHVGPYYVYGSHVSDVPPAGTIPIRIDAGLAFGTGNHETTQGCLRAIEAVCAERPPENPIDIGTGSGLLAIALARRFDIDIVASDNDPVAVDVARENAALNGVGPRIVFHVAEGLDNAALQAGAPYDLVVANIVANPLIALAGDVAGVLAPGGAVILSGILTDQAEDVASAYIRNGLVQADRIDLAEWVTLVLRAAG